MSEALTKCAACVNCRCFPSGRPVSRGCRCLCHIFESRYRKLLSDVRAADKLFGLSYFDSDASGKEIPPAVTSVVSRKLPRRKPCRMDVRMY